MHTIFIGTPEFAVPTLELLYNSGRQILAVVTQPDRPKGRHLRLQAPPVKTFALEKNLQVFQPTDLSDQSFKSSLLNLGAEVIVVVAYGKIIPQWILTMPPYGCINIHASLLPKYRGAAPIQRTLMDGCTQTGVTTMLLDEGMDTGDILLKSKIQIGPDDTAGVLGEKLAQAGARLLLETLEGLSEDRISSHKQDKNSASYAPKIEKGEALLEWSKTAKQLKDLIRALNPHPGAYTFFQGKRLKVFEARIDKRTKGTQLQPGTVIDLEKDGIVVASADYPLALNVVQPENKRKMNADEFLRGHQVAAGTQLG